MWGNIEMAANAALTKEIDRIMGEFVSCDGPGIVVLVGRDDRVLVRKGYGLANVDAGEPLVPGSRFIIGSVTKQFVGMCIMLLKDKALLKYDEPIGRFFPGFPAWTSKVTIKNLLQHTSGIPEYLTSEFWKEANNRHLDPNQEDVISRISSFDRLEFEPGTNWHYSNSNYVLLGSIIEQVSEQSFADFMEENIFEPLGMKDSIVGKTAKVYERMANGYEYRGKGNFVKAPYNQAVLGWADGNIISTVDDLFTWAQALYCDKLLSLEALSQAFVPWSAIRADYTRYGFGQIIGERRGVREIHHSGSTLGYNALLTRFTDEKLAIVVLSNAAGIGLDKVLGRICQAMLGDKMEALVPVSLGDSYLSEICGDFIGMPWERSTVLRISYHPGDTGAVAVIDGNQHREYHLIPLGRDLFLADKDTDQYIEFIRDYNGAVSGCRIKCLGRITHFTKARGTVLFASELMQSS